jgi:two-component system OmpR family response regulator
MSSHPAGTPVWTASEQDAPTADAATGPAPVASTSAPAPAVSRPPAHAASLPAADRPAPVAEEGWIEHNGLRLNAEMRIAEVDGVELELTRSEFDLASALMDSRRRVRSKADLALRLRGEDYVTTYYVNDADKRAVEVHMANLRRKLGDNIAAPRFIETVRGVGYRLAAVS